MSFLDKANDKYGAIFMVCTAVTILMVVLVGVGITILTNGIFLLLFPLGFIYMLYKTYREGDNQ
jgi:Flp pilus assembly protein TadB